MEELFFAGIKPDFAGPILILVERPCYRLKRTIRCSVFWGGLALKWFNKPRGRLYGASIHFVRLVQVISGSLVSVGKKMLHL